MTHVTHIGAAHTRQRKIVAEAFHYDAVQKLYPIFVTQAEHLISDWTTVCCSVLRCVAVCCSSAQAELLLSARTTVCCGVLRCVAVCCGMLRFVAGCCSVLRCVAVSCGVLWWVAVCCKDLRCVAVC